MYKKPSPLVCFKWLFKTAALFHLMLCCSCGMRNGEIISFYLCFIHVIYDFCRAWCYILLVTTFPNPYSKDILHLLSSLTFFSPISWILCHVLFFFSCFHLEGPELCIIQNGEVLWIYHSSILFHFLVFLIPIIYYFFLFFFFWTLLITEGVFLRYVYHIYSAS